MQTQPRPVKQALLIGSPVGDLKAVQNDVREMFWLLKHYEFPKPEYLFGPDATRQRILDALESLVKRTNKDDCIVVYYTGHGGITERIENAPDNGEAWRHQYIIPVDFNCSKPGDFRGILDIELSQYLTQLTKKTKNVTVILDCCHSNRLARGSHFESDERVKALHPQKYAEVIEHVRLLRDRGWLESNNPYVEGNKDFVRIAAAAATESAFEHTVSSGRPISALTEILTETLREARSYRISWQSISHRLRNRMALTMPSQHPEIAGPVSRLLFSLDERSAIIRSITVDKNNITLLDAGLLHGVDQGDVYAVLRHGEEVPDSSRQVGTATVLGVGTAQSRVRLEFLGVHNTLLSKELVAFETRKGVRRWPIRIAGDQQFVDWMSSFMPRISDCLRPAENDGGAEEILASLSLSDGSLVVRDQADVQLGIWNYILQFDTSWEITEARKLLEQLAKIQNILHMGGGTNRDALNADLSLVAGTVENGAKLPISGGTLHVTEGQNIFIEVKNNSSDTVYIHLFDTSAGEIGLMSPGTPTGRPLPPTRSHIWGMGDLGILEGWPLGWPGHVGADVTSLDETFIVIVTDTPIDLTSLESQAIASESRTAKAESDLQNLLRHFGCGFDKERLAKVNDPPPGPRYDVHQIHLRVKKLGR